MAVVQDFLQTTLSRKVFETPPPELLAFTAIPHAIVRFSINEAAISAKPAGDQQELIVGVVLPGNFVYQLLELNASLTQDVARDWEPRSYLEITNGMGNDVPSGQTNRWAFVNEDTNRVPSGGEMFITRWLGVNSVPRHIIEANTPVATPVISLKTSNQNANVGAAGTYSCWLAFMEFEIEQVRRYGVHFPIPTYPR